MRNVNIPGSDMDANSYLKTILQFGLGPSNRKWRKTTLLTLNRIQDNIAAFQTLSDGKKRNVNLDEFRWVVERLIAIHAVSGNFSLVTGRVRTHLGAEVRDLRAAFVFLKNDLQRKVTERSQGAMECDTVPVRALVDDNIGIVSMIPFMVGLLFAGLVSMPNAQGIGGGAVAGIFGGLFGLIASAALLFLTCYVATLFFSTTHLMSWAVYGSGVMQSAAMMRLEKVSPAAVPELLKLIEIREYRVVACALLGQLGPKAEAAVSKLSELIEWNASGVDGMVSRLAARDALARIREDGSL